MTATPYEWRKHTVAQFDLQIGQLQKQRDLVQTQLDELIKLRDSMAKVELKRPYTKGADKEEKPAPKVRIKKQTHWSKKPGVDPKKVAEWKKRMRDINLERNR